VNFRQRFLASFSCGGTKAKSYWERIPRPAAPSAEFGKKCLQTHFDFARLQLADRSFGLIGRLG
jgi:hypothetical protein